MLEGNCLELEFCELRSDGVLRSSPMWRSQKFGSEGCYSLSQKFRKKVAHFPPLHPIFIGNSSASASIKTNGVEEARHKGGKDRGKGIAARSQREHRKESVSMPSFLLCVSSIHSTLRFRSHLGQRKGASPKLRIDVSLKP